MMSSIALDLKSDNIPKAHRDDIGLTARGRGIEGDRGEGGGGGGRILGLGLQERRLKGSCYSPLSVKTSSMRLDDNLPNILLTRNETKRSLSQPVNFNG